VEAEMTARFSKGLTQYAILGRTLLNPSGGAAQKEANSSARLRCAELVMAVERYRLDHNGALPDLLERLAPTYLSKLPIDPVNGSGLAYERLPNKGYRVRSPSTSTERGHSTSFEDLAVSVLR
jgi:hypothetical protein